MQIMTAITEPAVGVVTNISGQEGEVNPLYNEARTLVESLPEDGVAILSYDQPRIYDLRHSASVPALTVSVDREGSSFGADLTAYNLVVALDKTGFDLRHVNQRYLGKWAPLLGAHQLYSVLAALGVGLSFGVELDHGLAALTEMQPLPGRMRTLASNTGATIIDDSFNADGYSLLAALAWLRDVKSPPSIRDTQLGQVSPQGNIYVALGAIDEIDAPLGVPARKVGSTLAQVTTGLIAEGEAAAAISRISIDSGLPSAKTHITFTPQDSARILNAMLGPKDVVLVKGNAASRMERILTDLIAEEDTALLARHDENTRRSFRAHTRHHTWLEVDFDAITYNLHRIKKLLDDDCKLMAVVKANAYGHGAGPVSSTLAMNGADYLGVARLDEALELRRAGITLPILVMSFVSPDAVPYAIEHDLTLTIFDANRARALNRVAGNLPGKFKAHVRLDIEGDGIGVVPGEAADFFRALLLLDNIQLEGIYANLDVSNTYQVESKISSFWQAVVMLRAADFVFDYVHLANSAAALHVPESRLSLVRIGAALYGIPPDGNLSLPTGFQPAITWKTTVAQVKRIPARLEVQDGTPITTGPKTAAILPIGRMDGFECCGKVLINEEYAEVIALIGMTYAAVDISDIDDVRIGDEAVLLGVQGNRRITYEDLAQALGKTPAEVALTVLPHLPRLT
jgi:alanine racemase